MNDLSNIKLLCLNVCGLKSKLLYPEFRELIESNDILVFVESKIDEYDILELPKGYLYFSKHRSKFRKKIGRYCYRL